MFPNPLVDPFTRIHVALDIPKHPTCGLGSSLPIHSNIHGGEQKEGGGYRYIDIVGWELISRLGSEKLNLVDYGDRNDDIT